MLAYRIVPKQFSTKISAPGFAGRWNSAGKKVVYCAESIALAFLENMIRRQGVGFNHDFRIMILLIPDNLKTEVVKADQLVSGWRSFSNYSFCQPVGNTWYDAGEFPFLKVPSAVIPESFNYVLNAEHPDFKKIKLIQVTDLVPDERIEDLLKKYR